MSKRPADPSASLGNDPKRFKLTALPTPPTMATGAAPAGGLDMAAIRAQIAARMASLNKGNATPTASSPAPPSPALSTPPPTSSSIPAKPLSSTSGLPANLPTDILARLAAQKARIAEQQARLNNPYLSGVGKPTAGGSADSSAEKKGGLSTVVAHPLLADLGSNGNGAGKSGSPALGRDSPFPGQGNRGSTPLASPSISGQGQGNKDKKERFQKTIAPKFTSVRANARMAEQTTNGSKRPGAVSSSSSLSTPTLNPYTALLTSTVEAASNPDTPEENLATRRARPTFKFATKGKFIQKANEQRAEAKMEELRLRIMENARKAGLEGEFDVMERSVKRQPPPEVEWWDAPLLSSKSYNDLDDPSKLLISTSDSLINLYVQHPIPIPAPWEGKEEEIRPLMLTKKEQKKMRRQRRAAELRDKQDRQKMGLLPPDPPKVRLANIMRVLTSSAIQDPTKVEAKVRSEVAQRLRQHEQLNASRALTSEQKKEKVEAKKQKEEAKGLVGAAFKIKYLVNGAHKFKVKRTADQLALHGLLIFHADFALVYVEGSVASLKKYKRLLTVRIDWTEEARPKTIETDGMDVENEDEQETEAVQSVWQPMQEMPDSLEENTCEIIWEGEVAEKNFRSLRYLNAESDKQAKEALGAKSGIWDLAKRWIWEDV